MTTDELQKLVKIKILDIEDWTNLEKRTIKRIVKFYVSGCNCYQELSSFKKTYVKDNT